MHHTLKEIAAKTKVVKRVANAWQKPQPKYIYIYPPTGIEPSKDLEIAMIIYFWFILKCKKGVLFVLPVWRATGRIDHY